MASWHDRTWPVRRWLVDRLVGKRGYSKNVAHFHFDYGNSSSYGVHITPRNPGETS